MGKKKRTAVLDPTELKAVAKTLDKGEGADVKGIKDKKLKREVGLKEKKTAQALRSAAFTQLLLPEDTGCLEADEGERTMKFKQHDIVKVVDVSSARKHFTLALPHHGPYRCGYSRNGRKLLIGGKGGHVASFDWQTGQLGCEFHVKETVNDIQWLHNRDYFAVAQKKYVYMYDGQGTELHRMKNHINPLFLEYLPYHWLLVSAGATGYLKYHDVSTGRLLTELKTRLGTPHSMRQNPWNAIMNLGHSNGTVTMWSPNMRESLVKMLCHHGPVTSIAVEQGGMHLVTSGMDRRVRIWDVRSYKECVGYLRNTPTPASHLTVSQTGMVAIAHGGHVQVYKDAFKVEQTGPYMTHLIEGSTVHGMEFAPFEDVLGLGHSKGFTSILVPGSGEANFDALEVNPYENKRQKQEGEIKLLMSKVNHELITLNPMDVHGIKPLEEEQQLEEKDLLLKFKMKGKNSAKRRFLRREKTIHDTRRSKIRAAMLEKKVEDSGEVVGSKKKGMLDRFQSKEA